MAALPIKKDSAYTEAEMIAFLTAATIPMRLAVIDNRGRPLVASHWFRYGDGHFYCAIHSSSLVAKLAARNPGCGFEIAGDTIPYHGVRGQGTVELLTAGAEENLRELILRYLGDTESALAKWLLGRAEGEYLVKITPAWVTSWDFRERMAK
jgi:nitroimidazol reductase NimA-like FMN-containing flavoprotein (pyridoxamine 5'-phosphate oxidase superfamily)